LSIKYQNSLSKKFIPSAYIEHLSIDCVIFGYANNELKVLVSKFNFGKNIWTLPGGYILKTESIDNAASRILHERTKLEDIYLQQFRVFGSEDRILNSPYRAMIIKEFSKRFSAKELEWKTNRFVCIGYYAIVDRDKVDPQNGEFDQYHEWRSLHDVPALIHDHNEILDYGLEALRQNFDQKLSSFNLLQEEFTMRELQALYEAVFNREFSMNNFQKKMLNLDILERLEKKYTGAQNKAPYLYRFKNKM
jgi:8-oxo-dGTP diphosphatase